ncbi:MAG: glycosyltransferase family 4 protein [Candidatus Peribacteraceae bacterium]|nr:glycosyltransferase family 4 protein [Candidatus Peribacteraceae bacterium]
MRIALFSSTIDASDGYGNITYELSAHYAKLGLDITLFLPRSQQEVADRLALPFPVRCELPEYIFRLHQPKALAYWRRVDLSGFDIAHSLFAFPYCLIAARSARKAGIPFIMGAQGTHGVRPLTYFAERRVLKWCYRQARCIAVPSEYTKRMILQYAEESYDIQVIHNGVHFDRFQKHVDPAPICKKYGDSIKLLTVGGLWGRKGHDIVLRALQRVLQRRTDVQYIIVGDGNARASLQALAQELGVAAHVDFAGRQSGDDLVRYFQACDIYVHTPKVTDDLKFEGFGIVYLEASACGKPIVATDAGGIRDAVLDGETGLIAPNEDGEGVADRILTLCNDADLRTRLGETGREYARKNDWSLVAAQFKSIYRSFHA